MRKLDIVIMALIIVSFFVSMINSCSILNLATTDRLMIQVVGKIADKVRDEQI